MEDEDLRHAKRLLSNKAMHVRACHEEGHGPNCLAAHLRDGDQRHFSSIGEVLEFLARQQWGAAEL